MGLLLSSLALLVSNMILQADQECSAEKYVEVAVDHVCCIVASVWWN